MYLNYIYLACTVNVFSQMEHTTTAVCILFTLFLPYCSCDKTGRRPTASKILPVLDLVEPEGKLYDPQPQDVNIANLRRILGASFDPKVMSEEEPPAYSKYPNGTVKMELRRTPAGHLVPQGNPPRQIKRLHLQHVKMGDGKKINLKLGNKMRRRWDISDLSCRH